MGGGEEFFCFVYLDETAGPSGKCQILQADTPDSVLQELVTTTTGPGKTTLRLGGLRIKRLTEGERAELGLPPKPDWADTLLGN